MLSHSLLALFALAISTVTGSAIMWNQGIKNVEKIILDIDPGTDDIEGCVLLINEHNQKKLQILAIVISEGNTAQDYGITNIFRLLKAANRLDIPVYRGLNLPILPHFVQLENFFGKDGFSDLPWNTPPPIKRLQKTEATKMIKELVDKYPDQVTYIILGPMTNLAVAMRTYKDLASKLKQIYAMGGLFNKEKGEFNILFDPEAAEIVFSMLNCPMGLFTWQACETNAPARLWFENATISNPVFDMVLLAEQALTEMHPDDPTWISCDPMAIATYLDRSTILQQYEAPLTVQLAAGKGRGVISEYESDENDQFPRHPVNVVLELDFPKAENLFLTSFDEICKTHRCSKP